MSQTLPDETLRKILIQIQQTAQQSSRALSISRAQIAQREKERRVLQLTINEIAAVPKESGGEDVKFYKGVGKMFMLVPRPEMEKDLKGQEKEANDDLSNLAKKSKYLEKQFIEAQAQLRDIFHNSEAR